ncbi:hypothetical protein CRG98_047298 [Punica granatum]|uniref:Uncharacterized protein n=1 Tax=Punica granatum TaxID=22663 RepID=A0A2I0HKX2_PUNGR|nr:hypothetical protein CRG98_047298 [Punica granatum]
MGMKMAVPLRHAGSAMEGLAWNLMRIENWARRWIPERPPKGFDVDDFPHAGGHLVRPAEPGEFDPGHYDHLLQLAVANYTAYQHSLICKPRLLKSNSEWCGAGYAHYMTFEALDCAAGTVKEYEARVFSSPFSDSFCHFCRVKGSKKIPPMPHGATAPSRPQIVDYNRDEDICI